MNQKIKNLLQRLRNRVAKKKEKKKFNPTNDQIKTAQLLFIAMAFREVVQKEVEKLEQEVLDSGTYHYADHYYTGNFRARGFELPEDRILRDREDICHMSGLKLLRTPEYQHTDACRFFAELRKKTIAGGFRNGENADCMADNDVVSLENQLIDVTYGIHKMKRENLIYLDHRKRMVNLLLNLFGPLVKNDQLDQLLVQFYNERVTEQIFVSRLVTFLDFSLN